MSMKDVEKVGEFLRLGTAGVFFKPLDFWDWACFGQGIGGDSGGAFRQEVLACDDWGYVGWGGKSGSSIGQGRECHECAL